MLESIFDPGTQHILQTIPLEPGWRCLEIGAGAGSIAQWMHARVQPTGQVVAVDSNTRFLSDLPADTLDVLEADIRAVNLPLDSFDLAHARFVLIHLADWQAAVETTLKLLKPGGYLVLEEPDFSVSKALAGPTDLCQAFQRVQAALEAMFSQRGCNFAFGSQLAAMMQSFDLRHLEVVNEAPAMSGGSDMALMMELSTQQLQEAYKATGLVTDQDLQQYTRFAREPACWAIYQSTLRVKGIKP